MPCQPRCSRRTSSRPLAPAPPKQSRPTDSRLHRLPQRPPLEPAHRTVGQENRGAIANWQDSVGRGSCPGSNQGINRLYKALCVLRVFGAGERFGAALGPRNNSNINPVGSPSGRRFGTILFFEHLSFLVALLRENCDFRIKICAR